jgi:hypothetical protein
MNIALYKDNFISCQTEKFLLLWKKILQVLSCHTVLACLWNDAGFTASAEVIFSGSLLS